MLKKFNAKRVLSLLLALVFVLTIAGCSSGRTRTNGSTNNDDTNDSSGPDFSGMFGNSSGNNSSGNNNSGSNNSGNVSNNYSGTVISSKDFEWPKYDFGDKKEVVILGLWDFRDVYKDLLKEQYGLKVKYVNSTWTSLYEDMQKMWQLGEGQAPDLVYSKYASHEVYSPILKGMLRPVEDYVDFNSPIWKDMKSIYNQTKFNGHNYEMYYETLPGPWILYNTKIFKDAGVDDLWETYKADPNGWDWNKLEEVGKAVNSLTATGEGVVGLATDDSMGFFHTTGQTFGEWGLTREDVKINTKNVVFSRAAEFLVKGRTDGWVDTAISGAEGKFANGTAAMLFSLGMSSASVRDVAKAGNLGIVPMAKDPEASVRWNYKQTSGFHFPTRSANPNGGAAFVTCMRYYAISDEGIKYNDSVKQTEDYLSDLNITQYYEPDNAGKPIVDPGQTIGYTNVWNCLMHGFDWANTFSGETNDTLNTYLDSIYVSNN